LVKIKIILPALLFAALLVVNGKLATKKSDADITLNQLRITNAHASEIFYPCGGVMCRWDYEWENVGLLVPALFAIVIVKPILLNDLGN